MNVFMLSEDHRERARCHPDGFLYWGSKEALQIVWNVWWQTIGVGVDRDPLRGLAPIDRIRAGLPAYLPTHPAHPWSVWARQSSENLWFLLEHAEALLEEDYYRFGRMSVVWDAWLCAIEYAPSLPCLGLTDMPRCFMGLTIETGLGIVEDYREYFRRTKAEKARWTRRGKPDWI